MKFIGFALALALVACTTESLPPAANVICHEDPVVLHDEALVVDLHNDVLCKVLDTEGEYDLGRWNVDGQSDLPRLKAGGVDIQFLGIWSIHSHPGESYQRALDVVQILSDTIADNPTMLAKATGAAEAERIVKEGKIAGILAVEGGQILEEDIANVDKLYEMGVRYIGITHDFPFNRSIGTSAMFAGYSDNGLSDFGKKAVQRMDDLGILVDISHSSPNTVRDVLAIVKKTPVVATHGAAYALHPIYRTMPDDQIKAVAERGGIIGVYFIGHLINFQPDNVPDVNTVLDHIDYIRDLVGVDYIGLGSDFDGMPWPTSGLEDASQLPRITEGLIRRGYSCDDIRKILGGNAMRVFRKVAP